MVDYLQIYLYRLLYNRLFDHQKIKKSINSCSLPNNSFTTVCNNSMLKTISKEKISDQLAKGATLITVNRRLSRSLTIRFNQHQVNAGKSVWESPDIIPFSPWLCRVYDQAFYTVYSENKILLPVLISPAQELYVWEQIIQNSESGHSLLQVAETAKAVMRAWEICKEWQLPFSELAQTPSEDTAAFIGWAGQFEAICKENGWQDNAGLSDAVGNFFESDMIRPPEQMIMAGFDELSPCRLSLLEKMQAAGSEIFCLDGPDHSHHAKRCELADTDTEINVAARWARACLEENIEGRIGVIVPDLQNFRPALIRVFDDVFHPSKSLSPQNTGNRLFNISLGQPLSEYPVVSAALLILQFACRSFKVDQYSAFLRSPFLAGGRSELANRSILDAMIRENNETDIPVSALIYFCANHGGRHHHPGVFCPVLHDRLKRFQAMLKELRGRQLPSGWAKDFSRLLNTMGWAGDRTLSSEEYQTVTAWNEALYQFAALDGMAGEMDIKTAVADLTKMLADIIFQPETDDVPVQIMGMLEAVGEQFDHVWIMGLNCDNWPLPSRPNPFLPIWVQQKYNVLHASPEREFEFARQITRRLLGAAKDVVVSYPVKDGETMLMPSPLIVHLKPVKTDQTKAHWWIQLFKNIEFEQITDHHGPPVGTQVHVSGGTGLIKAQAACPFSAFAGYRLNARPIESPDSGLNNRNRGTLVHHALEFFWEEIKTHGRLMAKSCKDLASDVQKAVGRAVSDMAAQHPRTFTYRFTEIEKQRLVSLLLEWLEMDRQRSPFAVIDREKKLVRTIAGIELKTYADRIDRLDDGRLVIVDYKTGEPKVADWFTERMAEPQLPLYSFIVDEPVAGVVFARIKKGKSAYLGVAAEEDIIPCAGWPGAKRSPMENFNSLKEVIDFWQGKIEFLADEIQQGYAAVMPVSINKSCRYCELGPLCRIGEVDFL